MQCQSEGSAISDLDIRSCCPARPGLVQPGVAGLARTTRQTGPGINITIATTITLIIIVIIVVDFSIIIIKSGQCAFVADIWLLKTQQICLMPKIQTKNLHEWGLGEADRADN
jgi:hypothetical protein